MSTLHMLVGIPGSGKSTYSNKILKKKYPDALFVASDKVRDANPNMPEVEIWPEIYRLCSNCLKEDKDLIFDATNITPKVRAHFVKEMNDRGAIGFEMIAYYFNTDPKVCFDRVTIRNTDPNERFLPTEIIEGYGQRIIPPTIEEGFKEIVNVDTKIDWRKQ